MSLLRRFSLLAIAACVVAVTCFAVPRVEAGSALSRLSSKLDGSYSPQPIRSRPSDRARTPSSRRASTNDRHVDPTPHNEGLVLKGFGVPRVEIIFDELLYAYKQLKPELTIQFEPTDELDVIDGFLYRSLYDYVLTDDRLDVASLPQRENLAIFPILIEPLVAAYHLVGDILVGDVSPDKCGPVHLSRYVVAAIYNLNITNWRDYRILQLQSPEVAAAMPNEPIRVVVQGSPNNDLRWMQDTLKQWGGPELAASGGWIYGPGFATINDPETEDTFGWSPEYLAQPNVVNVPFEFNIVQGIAVNKYSFALAEFSLVITEGFTQYAEFDNNLGQNLSSVSLIGAVPPTDALDPEAYFDGLRNATGDGVWPVGVPIFVMMRIANFSRELTCLERREMWLFWRWLLHSDIAQERLLLEGYVAMGDETLKVILDYISSIPCVENGTQGAVFLRELPIPQHQGNGFKTILGFNVTFLIISVFLVAGYIYTIKNKLSVPMINILIYFGTLLTGSVLNYVAVIYFYEVPSTSQICQNRVWLACLGFTMLLSAFFSRGYQIFAVHRMETSGIAMLQGVSHNAIQTSINAFAVSVQLVLLIIWTKVDPFEPIKTQIDDLNLTFSYLCASKHTWVWWGLEIAYALVLEGFGLLVVYRTWNLRRTVKESKWVSIAIYNFLVVLTLLVALFASMAVTDDVVLLLGGIATTCLSFVTMSSLFLPRLLRLHALAQKDTDSDDVSDKRNSQLSNLSTGAAAASTNTRRTPGSARSSEDHGSRFLPSIPSTRVATPKGPSPSQSTVDIPSSPLNTYQPSPRPTHHTLPSIPSRSAAEAEELVEAAQQQQQSEPSSPSLGPDMQSLGPYTHQTAVLIANFGSESNLNNSTHSDH